MNDERSRQIQAAGREYDAHPEIRDICSRTVFIDGALRERGLMVLSEIEAHLNSVSGSFGTEFGGASGGVSTLVLSDGRRVTRRQLIDDASREFDQARARRMPTICGRHAWIDGALHDAGAPVMTLSEKASIADTPSR
jgi:hypothetical protein